MGDVAAAPDLPARVVVEMEDRRPHEAAVMYPKGDPGHPLSDAELDAKLHDNVRALVPEAEARALAEAIRVLPAARSVRALARRQGRQAPSAPFPPRRRGR